MTKLTILGIGEYVANPGKTPFTSFQTNDATYGARKMSVFDSAIAGFLNANTGREVNVDVDQSKCGKFWNIRKVEGMPPVIGQEQPAPYLVAPEAQNNIAPMPIAPKKEANTSDEIRASVAFKGAIEMVCADKLAGADLELQSKYNNKLLKELAVQEDEIKGQIQ